MEVSHTSGSHANDDGQRASGARHTLAIDCGGGGIKTSLLDCTGEPLAAAIRTPVPYPFSPADLLDIVATHADALGDFDRITMGITGMIRGGHVIDTPHYICADGPHSEVDPALAAAWRGFDMTTALRERFDCPVLVLNDAEVAAAAVVSGVGCELVLTLGTGLGNAIVVDGYLAPHLEISHIPACDRLTFDEAVSEARRQQIGTEAWSQTVVEVLALLWKPIRWDVLYLGGGNTIKLTEDARTKILATYGGSERVHFIPNAAGMTGGVKAWNLASANHQLCGLGVDADAPRGTALGAS